MHQQINLYQPIFREERKLFSLRTVGIALGAIALGLIGVWLFAAGNVKQLQRDVAGVAKQLEAQKRMAAAAGALIQNQTSPEQVAEQVRVLSKQLAERSQALALLRSGAAGESKGFAGRMNALARRPMEGLWLDRLSFGFDAVGTESRTTGANSPINSPLSPPTNPPMNLWGRAVTADLVPKYLQALAAEPELQGARFDEVVLDRRESHEPEKPQIRNDSKEPISETSTVRFSVATRLQSKEPRS